MTREKVIDRAVRMVKGDQRWRLIGETIVAHPCHWEGESVLPMIRAAFRYLSAPPMIAPVADCDHKDRFLPSRGWRA